ncbi:MAG: helix-turn-helix domain-containing protein [Pseudobdellovibrio sp.]|nr:helix-turn-helix domain-containing protein [Pseudobdellovibrio sp.]
MKGQEFKNIRTRLGLTQEELANVLGLSGKKAVGNIETEFRQPSVLIIVVMRFLDGLEITKARTIMRRFSELAEAARRKKGGTK